MMNEQENNELIDAFTLLKIPKGHVTVGFSNLISCNNQFRSLFINRRLPDTSWSDVQIQHFIYILSTLDTNNKKTTGAACYQGDDDDAPRWCGVGEREGRIYSSLVLQRHFGFSHGIGRSGDITEPQPKAVGSSILAKLTLLLTLDVIRRGGSGLDAKSAARYGILLPLCTGMSISLVLSALREKHPKKSVVLWCRIDQKSCYKAITSAGLQCIVVPTKLDGDAVVTDLDAMKTLLEQYNTRILALITTTSCFAPRVPDQVDQVAKLCKTYSTDAENSVYHIINNAYGLQCPSTCRLINRACVIGKVDAIVSSTDKNFLVPVGGAIVLAPSNSIIEAIGKLYAGRASISPILDLFITLLSMGLSGYKRLYTNRLKMIDSFTTKFQQVAEKYGERILTCPMNTISSGITLDQMARPKFDGEDEDTYLQSIKNDISKFGAMLFSRCISGTRVIPRADFKSMGEDKFHGFGSSYHHYPHAYMTAACAIGVTENEVNEFFVRLDKTFKEFKKG